MKLTAKQQRFVEEYLIDLNATQAAIRAGYSKKNADKIGPELLGKTRVAEKIDEARQSLSKRAEITQEWVLNELKGNHSRAKKIDELGASNKALELIGKHLGMFKDKIEHSGETTQNINGKINVTQDLSKLSVEELKELESIISKTSDTG